MRILALSEHFAPRVGGTARYVQEICSALAARGVRLKLLVPGPRPRSLSDDTYPYEIVWIDAGYPENGDPSRASRYRFSREAARCAGEAAERGEFDIAHVLFGLFIMEALDTRRLLRAGVPSVTTIHNLPPMECARSFEGEPWYLRLRDAFRLTAVALKNNNRLRRHEYAAYLAPSLQVRTALSNSRPGVAIHVIGHGPSTDLLEAMNPPQCRRPEAGPLRLLTLGGWVPHKRQHLIPQTASRLKDAGIDFCWTVAGPAGRIPDYKARVDQALATADLADVVCTLDTVPFDELARLYDRANLYVQPSTEEGFCITALDAAAAGVPVIGSPAGALPDICEASSGRLVASDPDSLADAILEYCTNNAWPDEANIQAEAIRARFSWSQAADQIVACYDSITTAVPGMGAGASTPAVYPSCGTLE